MRMQLPPLLLLTSLLLPRAVRAQQLPEEPPPPVLQQHTVSREDSLRLLRRARRAQSSFEQVRLQNLPRTFGTGASGYCDVRIGRWCYWHDADDEARDPPPESPRTRSARVRLLATLDSLRAQLPGDRWIVGQTVFYQSEAGRHPDAIGAARACAAAASDADTHAWCEALAGYALHQAGSDAAADTAYDAMLADLSQPDRCTWEDLTLLMDDDAAGPYRTLGCGARAAANARFWRLSEPLYLIGADDFRSEIFSRITRARMQRDARNPMGMSMSDADRELLLRYGGSNWFERVDPPIGSMQDVSVTGHESGHATVNFVPGPRALAAPESLAASDWSFDRPTARVNYSPVYLKHFHRLPRHQLAVFRRGDSALVLAALDAQGDTTLSSSGLRAGLLLASLNDGSIGAPAGEILEHTGTRAVLAARSPWRPFIASLELLDTTRKAAVRARFAVRPPYATSRLTTSDLLLFAPVPGGSPPASLAAARPLMLATDTVSARAPLGLFWETYGLRASGETLDASLSVERIGTTWLRHTVEALHLASRGAPVHVHWQERPGLQDGIASRAVVLDLSRLSPGRYRVRLTLAARGDHATVTTREIEVR
ncbi:MAG TPA: hypothetical protein VJU87_01875 [Gemmatimonadaceae bacterium]|nr:hypothetical protein [Gemmatimonadaceae bacterium]